MTAPVRSAPSGALIQPVPSEGLLSYTLGSELPLELVPLGHEPGLYRLALTFYPVALASGGTVTINIGYSHPGFGPTVLAVGVTAPTVAGFSDIAFRLIESDGTAPITATFVPAAVTGSPVQQVACYGIIAALPVED